MIERSKYTNLGTVLTAALIVDKYSVKYYMNE